MLSFLFGNEFDISVAAKHVSALFQVLMMKLLTRIITMIDLEDITPLGEYYNALR